MTEAADFQPAELERHRAFLQGLARELVRGEAAAEDLVQDAFVRALERPPRSAAALRAWLGRVARALAINRARGTQRSGARERRVARPEAQPSHVEALASLELQERVIAAVKALDEPYRSTLWLRFHEGLAPGAIAARQETTTKTVESRLTRGLALLRAELDRRSGGDRAAWLSGVLVLARGSRASVASLVVGAGIMNKLAVVFALLVLAVTGWMWRSASGAGRASPAAREADRTSARPTAPSNAAVASPQRLEVAPDARARATSEPRGGLHVVVRWSDGEVAPEVGLFVFSEDDARRVVRTRTDERGEARVDGLHPGRVRVEADRGGSRTVAVVSGAAAEVALELETGIDLEGTVTSADGTPIGGAEILLVTERADWLAMRVVARALANGSYRVRAVQPEFAVTARAGELAPALVRSLPRGRTGTVRIDFVLDTPGLWLRGIVRDPAGAPVPGALVASGDPQGFFVQDEETDEGPAWLAVRALCVEETDSGGRFDALGLVEGFGLSIAVQADDYPIALANVPAGSGAFTEVFLEEPCTLSGVVRDSAGTPVPGATLALVVTHGTSARDIPFALPRATSDGEGRYRLELLPPGAASIRVDAPKGAATGRALVALDLAPGEQREDFVLADGDTLRGRVVAPLGTSVDGWSVRAWATMEVDRVRSARVDAQGRFAVAGCALPPYTLELSAASDRPVLHVTGIGPGRELVLRPEAPGEIEGRFVDESRLVPDGERAPVALRTGDALEQRLLQPSRREADGGFRFECLRAGRYQLTIGEREHPLCSTWLDLAAGQHLDLGLLRGQPPGGLEVELVPPPGSVLGTVLDGGFQLLGGLEPLDGALGVGELAPGECYLALQGEGVASRCEPFVVRPGERTRLSVALEPGVPRTLHFPLPAGAAEWSTLLVRVRNADGRLRFAHWLERRSVPGASDGAPPVLVALPVGTFTVEAQTDTGLAARGTFDVPALEPQDAALSFELR